MRKGEFFEKIRLISKSGFLASSLLNIGAMEKDSRGIAIYKINDNDYINEIEFLEDENKCLEFKYIKEKKEVSTLTIMHISDFIQIMNLETKIDYSGQGLATKLLLCMFNSVSKLNNGKRELPDMYLDSTAEGRSLYKKLGFREIDGDEFMGLQPMVLTWNSDERRRCLTVNENNEIVKIDNMNNIINNNNNEDDNSDDDIR